MTLSLPAGANCSTAPLDGEISSRMVFARIAKQDKRTAAQQSYMNIITTFIKMRTIAHLYHHIAANYRAIIC